MNLLGPSKATMRSNNYDYLDDYFAKCRALGKEVIALHEQAGIAEEVERLESLFEPDYFRDRELAPLWTNERERQEKERDASDWLAYRNGLRYLYFIILDKDIRRRLIEKTRKFRELRLTFCVNDLHHARKLLNEIESKSDPGCFMATLSATIVLLGAAVGNLIGALAAAVFAVILGIYTFKAEQLRHDREKALAQDNVQKCEDALKEEESRQEIFSYSEQVWGEPDPVVMPWA